jgi:predicted DNA-binding transcriptional regulator AlpA
MTNRIAVPAAEAAHMLGLPRSRFREYVAAGLLPVPVLIGRDELWRVADLMAAVNGHAMDEGIEW